MIRKLLFIALFLAVVFYFGSSNPTQEKYVAWASQQFVQNSSFHQSLEKTATEDPSSVWGELAKMGKQLTEKVVQPQIGHLLAMYTTRTDYALWSVFTTEYTIAGKTYTYVTLGIANQFFLLSAPK
ncbi:DUF4359 domain-containing protein [Ectobacillus sp. sgz5001026]|uniref:DUF4359 domain-containing protein n=1 Tax=Ectobacillus sp. sgz5001026 TaxID=3242473 RepID=UPI0036D28BBA